MARTIKIDNAILKRRSRFEEKRKTEIRTKRKFYLIVCEGEKTEPNYFNALKSNLPRGILELVSIDVEGTGKNTLSIIEETKRLKKVYEDQYLRKIDKIWAVFDKDSFTAEQFNNAILKGETSKPKINCAWSNEAFELWYLLHFSYYNTGVSRARYQHLLKREITKVTGNQDYRYKKNSTEMFELLDRYGDQEFAIVNAKKLDRLYFDKKYADHNPQTKVHILIEELNRLSEISKANK